MAVQNEQLDRFHVKDSMQQAAQDIQGGRILQVRSPRLPAALGGGCRSLNRLSAARILSGGKPVPKQQLLMAKFQCACSCHALFLR